MENNEKIIVYLGGGAMSGVYGAGVLKGMHDLSLVENVEAIYGSSVGALNAASEVYFTYSNGEQLTNYYQPIDSVILRASRS